MATGYWEHVAMLGCIQAIVGLGFYVTFLCGQFSAAHATLLGVGAYVAGMLSARAGVPFAAALLLGACAASAVAALLMLLLRRLSGMIFAIATLAVAEIAIVVLKNSRPLGGALGLSGVPLQATLWQAAIVLILVIVGFTRFEESRLGLAFRAVRDDADAAAASGIQVMHMRVLAFALGGFLCGLGGGLQVHYLGVIEPDELGFYMTVALLLYTVIGGRDHFSGTVLAAFVFTALPELLRVTSRGRIIVFSLILILIVLWRPGGLIARPVFWRSRAGAAKILPEP
ncbi:MAG: branched-chain amino acid ABC transporter permease [Burkholderiaceae bacterium]